MGFWICIVLSCLISSMLIYYVPDSDIRLNSYDHLNFSRASIVQFLAVRYIIGLNKTSMSKVMNLWICIVLPCFISSISIYYAPKSDIRVNSYDHLNLCRDFVVQFWASRYIIGLNQTSESKVMAVWISHALWCIISSMSIYYALELDIRVKKYDHLNFSKALVVQFRASRYIIGLNRASESKVMVVWICLVLPCLISSISIHFASHSDIRVKSNDDISLSRASIVQFRASQYIIGLNQISESKVMGVWICLVLPCLILSISIYFAPESDIRVNSYNLLSFSRASVGQFWMSQCIIGLSRTSEWKVMPVSIFLTLPCWISSISIYCALDLDIRVKSYDHLNFSRTSDVPFQVPWYIIGLNWTSESKVMAIWICNVVPCIILSISIYDAPDLDIRLKTYEYLNFSRASVIQFCASRYIIGLNRTSDSKVVAVWICLELPCLISSISINYSPESDIQLKTYVYLNFLRDSIVQL